ncbi:hypothetical protein O181_000992 [Austropuccinia psidii MF-1]|uniref:RNA exonuclease 4 n=1 Tax=Austropuccinia psidii MF-1 TaxID=1389203 RepID=A0A9Q3GCL0_9BASI|nr:hypothetical protein [Austropuccinia psidii MF-1]
MPEPSIGENFDLLPLRPPQRDGTDQLKNRLIHRLMRRFFTRLFIEIYKKDKHLIDCFESLVLGPLLLLWKRPPMPPKTKISSTSERVKASSNWKKVQLSLPKHSAAVKAKILAKKTQKDLKAQDKLRSSSPGKASSSSLSQSSSSNVSCSKLQKLLLMNVKNVTSSKQTQVGKYVAIDCEMVGVGPKGSQSALARVSLVNFFGVVLLDSYVRPKEKVTDYRTWVSGIKPQHLKDARSFEEIASQVAEMIKDKVLIGHAISNDLNALLLKHPRSLIRDTSAYKPLQKIAKTRLPSLKKLTALLLKIDIQKGSHSSVDDARATMAIYRTQKNEWEAEIKKQITLRPKTEPKRTPVPANFEKAT